jgi:hypothetical protein
LHLLLQGADGGIKGGQLPLHTVAPETQHVQAALLKTTQGLLAVGLGPWTAPKQGNHGSMLLSVLFSESLPLIESQPFPIRRVANNSASGRAPWPEGEQVT